MSKTPPHLDPLVDLSESAGVNAELTQEDIDRIHPLVGAALIVVDERGAEDLAFDEGEMAGLREGLEEIYGTEGLRLAVRGLLNLGAHLHETNAGPASKQLLDMLAEAPLIAALDGINATRHETSSEEVAKTSQAFDAFADQKNEKVAPKVGEEKPDGALSIDQLKFPKRL